MVSHRSTKGASKARRDHINHEIRNMRALLPISQEDQERLSYLHSMAAICTYIRKSVLFQGLLAGESLRCFLPYEAFLQALHGFILVTTAQGRLVYVSENVEQYLGISMVDVLQGDTLYDMVESSDVAVVKSNLDTENNSSSERSFVCCMQTTKAFKVQHGSCCSMMVNGSFRYFPQSCTFSSSDRPHDQPLFVALCTPTVNRVPSNDSHLCQSFNSVHGLDMSFIQLSDRVLYFLGYGAEELMGRSWYSLVHPEDLPASADSHRSLLQADEGFQVEIVLRLQCKDLSWTWMYIQATKDSGCQSLSCTNFLISETEARYLRQKVSSDAYRPSSLLSSCSFSAQQACHAQNISGAKCFKRQRASNSQSEELTGPRAGRESERDSSQRGGSPAASGDSHALFTPPYSPASSSSPLQAEELSHELLMDVHGYAERLLSSPESSPSYYTRPQAGLACHQSPRNSLPAPSDRTFEPAAFVALGAHSPPSSSSPAYDFQACPSDARLVPDSLSMSDLSEMPVDCALHQDDFSLLQQPQGGSPVQVQHVPFGALVPTHSSLPTPNQSPTHSESDRYSEIEQAEISILAQQISSLASSFSTYHATTCDWPPHPHLLPQKPELVLDDGVFDSILTELDLVARKGSLPCQGAAAYSHQQLEQETLALASDLPQDLLPAEQFTVMEALSLQLERHDQTTGLHQLNFYMQSEPQQDGLAEESLY